MSNLQIILLILAGVFAFGAILFLCLYLADGREKRECAIENNSNVESVFVVRESELKTTKAKEEKKEDLEDKSMTVNEMLEKLNRLTENDKNQSEESSSLENKEEETQKIVVKDEKLAKLLEDENNYVVESDKKDNSSSIEEKQEATTVEEVVETKTVETNQETTTVEQTVETTVEDSSYESTEVEPQVIERVEVKTLDYKDRLEKITQTRDKISRDLEKLQNSILKYERTKRRKERNQKMLDRRAGELANLNLVMYSVTDIKNVDEDKKVKQEELTAHIAELKASIQDAEEYIESNKEKNAHDVSMAKFLLSEKARYNDEIIEIEKLIKETDEVA